MTEGSRSVFLDVSTVLIPACVLAVVWIGEWTRRRRAAALGPAPAAPDDWRLPNRLLEAAGLFEELAVAKVVAVAASFLTGVLQALFQLWLARAKSGPAVQAGQTAPGGGWPAAILVPVVALFALLIEAGALRQIRLALSQRLYRALAHPARIWFVASFLSFGLAVLSFGLMWPTFWLCFCIWHARLAAECGFLAASCRSDAAAARAETAERDWKIAATATGLIYLIAVLLLRRGAPAAFTAILAAPLVAFFAYATWHLHQALRATAETLRQAGEDAAVFPSAAGH